MLLMGLRLVELRLLVVGCRSGRGRGWELVPRGGHSRGVTAILGDAASDDVGESDDFLGVKG